MASATTTGRPTTFPLRLTTSPSLPNPTALFLPTSPKLKPKPKPLRSKPPTQLSPLNSIDISKEDKPTSDPNPNPIQNPDEPAAEEDQLEKRRLEERFAVLNTGIHECRSCGYRYDQAQGDPAYPAPPGLPFERLPEDWRCPTCGAAKGFFQSKSVEIAGFAENQQFGLGGNALTSGQKTLLIYGSLLFFFVLFLSGYFLQ